MEGTVFGSGKTGFSGIAATKKQLRLYMVDRDGNVIHTVEKTKK